MCYIDLHIHTALSACADDDMTPNNIVNMSVLKELDIIAVTDHNTSKNAEVVMECAKGKDLIVIPGMELETREEVHVVCLFPSLKAAHDMDTLVSSKLPDLKNRPEIFGRQVLFDKNDNNIGFDERLLSTAVNISIAEAKEEVEKRGGIVFPAHINRPSFSILSNLGFIDETLGFKAIETYGNDDKIINKYSDKYIILQNSDAHKLSDILEPIQSINLKIKSVQALIDFLKQGR
jgi:PHP family Zn ribbon phosphoesterase